MPSVGSGSRSKEDTHLGKCIVMYADLRQVGTMERIDRTDPHRKMRRHTRRIGGDRINTIIWFEEVGAERIPQKSITRSVYKKQMREYWATLCPTYLYRAQRMRIYTNTSNNDD